MNKIHIDNWDEFFMRHVYLAGSKSKDKSTQIGAILVRDGIVISEGYNGICRNVDDSIVERSDRPEKYHWYEHGERNAVYNCAKIGTSSNKTIMYTNDTPCTDCGRAVIQAGIKEVVLHKQWGDVWRKLKGDKWKGQDERSLTMFNEAGVKVRWFDSVLGLQCLISEKVCEV